MTDIDVVATTLGLPEESRTRVEEALKRREYRFSPEGRGQVKELAAVMALAGRTCEPIAVYWTHRYTSQGSFWVAMRARVKNYLNRVLSPGRYQLRAVYHGRESSIYTVVGTDTDDD